MPDDVLISELSADPDPERALTSTFHKVDAQLRLETGEVPSATEDVELGALGRQHGESTSACTLGSPSSSLITAASPGEPPSIRATGWGAARSAAPSAGWSAATGRAVGGRWRSVGGLFRVRQ